MSTQPSHQNDVLKQLCTGTWVFDFIYPAFREALLSNWLKGNRETNVPTLAMCCARYRPEAQLPQTLKKLSGLRVVSEAASDEVAFWAQAIETSHPEARFAKPSSLLCAQAAAAVQLIQSSSPATYAAFNRFVTHLVPFNNSSARSFSHPHFFGAIFLDLARSPQEIAVSIVHEMAHQELFLVNLVDRLVPNGADYSLAHAPFQGKVRPPIGRLHSAHALFRMAQFMDSIGSPQQSAHRALLSETVASFQAHELTPFAFSVCREAYVHIQTSLDRNGDLSQSATSRVGHG